MSRRQVKIGLVALCGALCALAGSAGSASAARSYNTPVGESFSQPNTVVFDANKDIWVSDSGHFIPNQSSRGQNGLYQLDAFPSQHLLEVPDTYPAFEFFILSIQVAVDQSTGQVFASQANGRAVDIFTPTGGKYVFTHAWTGINEVTNCCPGDVHIAIDNSNGFSRGRVYLSLTAPENDVEALDAGQRPVDFPATASYIKDNRLTGTPSGPFGQVEQVSVDSNGNLYVVDAGKSVVDEFDSTGTFLRTFPDPSASGGYPGSGGVGVDPTNGNVLITAFGGISEYDSSGNFIETVPGSNGAQGVPSVNPEGYLYTPNNNGSVGIFNPDTPFAKISYAPVSSPTTTSGTLNATVDPNGAGNVTECKFEYGTTTAYSGGTVPCSPAPPYSGTESVSAGISGLTTGTTYHYRAVAKDVNGTTHGEDQVYTPGHVLALSTDPATEEKESSAMLNGSFVGNGEDTHYYFEWGSTTAYGHVTAVAPGTDAGSPSGPSRTAISSEITGLSPYTTYHYRVVASNGGGTNYGADRTVTTIPGLPTGRNPSVTAVHSDRVELHGEINPHGGNTTAQFEYVDDANFQLSGWADAKVAPVPGIEIGMGKQYESVKAFLNGLQQGTLYHYRVEGTNSTGSGGIEATFRTFPFIPTLNDPCPNAHVRQQTGASLLLDCRAYEIVSAANSGGYDVESSLVSSQTPFAGYPEAHRVPQVSGEEPQPEVLYGVHDGGIPGTGSPTNRGVDPYVATRGENGWTTRYAGIPADNPYAKAPFSSTLAEANSSLETLAFGGPEICSPCFEGGKTGIPVHKPNGELVQGMAGSLDPGPAAKPEGFIGRHLSADGTHLVFGSKSKFEPDANEGEVAIYDRNLNTGETHVVSKTPAGQTMKEEGTEIGELDISKDGSRIVIGHLVEEVEGAKYWHLYMNIADSGETIDLTPGTTHGVLYDGMTEDGTKVFFTTKDALTTATNQDTDHSADIYEAEVDPAGTMTLSRISTGSEGAGNSDECEPAANTAHEHWNTTGPEENCGVVAVGGGGGVAASDGTIYFLSPEKLDGSSNGVQNAPNLYVARPSAAPHFVTTLESSLNAPLPLPLHPYLRSFGAPIRHVAGVAIDHATGDIYTLDIGTDIGTGYVYKFDRLGHPVLSFGINGKLTVSGMLGFYGLPCELAVDNDPSSPNYGDLYVPNIEGSVGQYNSNGGHLGTINVPDTATGVAVDASSGDVYASGFSGRIYKYDTSGKEISSFAATEGATGVAVDSSGRIYVVNGGGFGAKGTTEIYNAAGNHTGQLDANPSYAVAVDPTDNHIFVDEGNQVTEFNPAGEEVGVPTGDGVIGGSIGVGADAGYVDVGNPSQTNVASFGTPFIPSDPQTDNPVVVDSVSEPGTRHMGDFQVTPSGDYAAFTSTLSLTGYVNAAHREVYRYNGPGDQLECASCNPTSETATGDAALAPSGLSLTNDGRVFFNSNEGLVDRDLNEREDAYEWEPNGFQAEYEHEPVPGGKCEGESGCVELISTGTALLGSKLLGATGDGTDAFFFTRDTLVSEDHSGNRVKIYDARTFGGFPQSPEPVPCKASDECHGPGSQAPPPPEIKSISPSPGGNLTETPIKKCKAKYVKRNGRCVKTRRHHRHHHRKAGRHG
jgi:hypothetical protein